MKHSKKILIRDIQPNDDGRNRLYCLWQNSCLIKKNSLTNIIVFSRKTVYLNNTQPTNINLSSLDAEKIRLVDMDIQ